MGILLNISASVITVTTLFALTRQLHMFQLNSYYPSRYLGWLKTAFTAKTAGSVILSAALVLSLFLGGPIFFLCIAAISAIITIPTAISSYKNAIKKIVFTPRIKRIYISGLLIFTAFIIIANFVGNTARYVILTAVIMLSLLTPVTALLINLINSPIEKLISRWYVNDARRILQSHRDLTVIGITGSYGKTSTKYVLGRILSEQFNVVITPESYNTPMGIVRTVRKKLKPGTEIFVAEMGAKNKGDIKEICDIADPSMGIITSIGPQHLDTFGDLQTIVSTKFELADHVLGKSGAVFLNCNNEYIARKSTGIPHVSYGTGIAKDPLSLDFRAEDIHYGRNGSSFDIIGENRRVAVSTRLLGAHNILNILAAAAVAVKLGLSDNQIKYAVSQLKPVTHRLELKPFINGALLIDDAYNANPEGCLEAVNVLGSFDGMQKIIVTPGLVELGEREYECNYNLGLCAGKTCNTIILVGEKRAVPMADAVATLDFKGENLHIVPSFKDAMDLLRKITNQNSVVLFENDLPDNYAG